MLCRSLSLRLASKPASGYVTQLPPRLRPPRSKLWRTAAAANHDVAAHFHCGRLATPGGRGDDPADPSATEAAAAEVYAEWYRRTYGLEELGDGRAASGAPTNRLLDDAANTTAAATEYDYEGVQEELEAWRREFQPRTLCR